MRSGVTQSSPTANPDERITVSGDTYSTQDGGRLTRGYEDERVWGGQYVIELDNSDEALNSKNYKGCQVTLYHGFIGESGSNLSPLWVHNQQFISKEGKLLLQLNCIDAWGLLSLVNADLAMAAYNQNWQQSDELDKLKLPSGEEIPAALKAAITANYNRTIFSILGDLFGTISKSVTLDDNDGITSARKPAIRMSNPISGIRQLLEMTESYAKWKTDGTFGIVQPTAHSVAYSFNVSNLFFSNAEDAAVTIPNRITFYSLNEDGDDWISGTPAVDAESYGALGVYVDRHYLLGNFEIDARASEATLTALAAGTLTKIQEERSQGFIVAPMHCSLELFDKVEVVDDRYDTPRTTTGYVHRIIREYDRGVYRISVQLGGVTSGYTPPNGDEATPLHGEAIVPSVPGVPLQFLPAYLPAVIDIDFTAVDNDDVSWTEGTITTADGSVWNVSSGNKNLANDDVYYAYYDTTADDGDIDWTQDFGDTVTHERILIGFFKKAAEGEKALIVIGTKGADLFIDVLSAITANLGLINAGEIRIGSGNLNATTSTATGGSTTTLEDTGQSWTTNQWMDKTVRVIQSGFIYERTVSSNTSNTLTFPALDNPVTEGTTYYLGGGSYTGWRLWMEAGLGRMAGYNSGDMQFYVGSDGMLYAGIKTIKLSSLGLDVNVLPSQYGAPSQMLRFLYDSVLQGHIIPTSFGLVVSTELGTPRKNIMITNSGVSGTQPGIDLYSYDVVAIGDKMLIPVGTDKYN